MGSSPLDFETKTIATSPSLDADFIAASASRILRKRAVNMWQIEGILLIFHARLVCVVLIHSCCILLNVHSCCTIICHGLLVRLLMLCVHNPSSLLETLPNTGIPTPQPLRSLLSLCLNASRLACLAPTPISSSTSKAIASSVSSRRRPCVLLMYRFIGDHRWAVTTREREYCNTVFDIDPVEKP